MVIARDAADGRHRSAVSVGDCVDVVEKHHQRSGKKTRGFVADILTTSAFHPHGIKVRLRDGRVGRVTTVFHEEKDENEGRGECKPESQET